MRLEQWTAAQLPRLLMDRKWPRHDTLTGEQVDLEVSAVEALREDDGVAYQATWRLIFRDSGAVTDLKVMRLGVGFLPTAAGGLPVPADIERVVGRWLEAVDEVAARLWRIAEYPRAIMPANVVFGPPALVNLIVAHVQQGPATPRPMALTPRAAPLAMEVAAAGESPAMTVLASPDVIELHVLDFLSLEIVARTPEARAVMLRREGGLIEIIGGQTEEVRAVLCWLAQSARAAGDPLAILQDPADGDEEPEVYPTLLSGLLDELASTAWLDWRIEPDSLARARSLPDWPGQRLAWSAFLSRHFCP